MTNKQKDKLKNRLQEIEKILDERFGKGFDNLDLYTERNEIEFKLNKENINFTLRGDNKYYHAHQCKKFEENLKIHGYGHIKKEDIIKDGICFNNYSINNGYNQYCLDIKRFNNKEELLGFVVGYNQSLFNQNK
tara:strand:+ start:223 stop:624 length:402 start_codon:yes stop_codon:yes gene_type:complete